MGTTVGEIKSTTRNALVGGPFGSNLVSADYVDRGVPVIRGQNMGPGRWVDGEFAFVSESKADGLSPNQARPGDLVFTQRGTIGQVAVIPQGRFDRYVISQSQMKLTPDKSKADVLFLYYLFSSPTQQDYIRRNAIQTGVPHTNLGILRDTPLHLPPLHDQQEIARVLGGLDDKIELNRRMNETLDAVAGAIFKSWFLDTPMPTSAPLDQIAQFLNGLALQKFPPTGKDDLPVIKIAELRRGNTEGSDLASGDIPEDYVVKDGDVLFSWSGSLEVVIWCGGKGALNQHLFKVTSRKYPKWFYYFWTREHLTDFQAIAASKATTMGHIQRHHLGEAEVGLPSTPLLKRGDAVIAPILDRIARNNLESQTLRILRDTLLPKLMSGEIRIKQAERSMEAPA